MAGEYNHIPTGRGHVKDFVALTGDMAMSDTIDLAHDLIGLNVEEAGYVRILTSAGTDIAIYVEPGMIGTAPIRRIHTTGTTAVIKAGII